MQKQVSQMCMTSRQARRHTLMRGILFAALATSAVAPFDIRDFFSSTENKMSEIAHHKMSEIAHQAAGATKSIQKKVLPRRPDVQEAGSSVAPLLQAAFGSRKPPPPGNMADTMGRAVAGAATASSTAPAAPEYAVRPCRAGMYELLTVGKGQLGPRPPKWPVPTETGLFFTSHYASCPDGKRGGDCWWRTNEEGRQGCCQASSRHRMRSQLR